MVMFDDDGYYLAEAGYDVWLGNARGNSYSRNHISLNPDGNNDFWKFSWDEIGNYDLPAFIDYILATTGESKIHYVGRSQGGTSFLVLNSLRSAYNEKIASFQGQAPACFFTYNENPIYKAVVPYESIIEATAWSLGIGEIFGNRDFLIWFEEKLCQTDKILLEKLCSLGVSLIFNSEYSNSTMLPVIVGHTPAGSSIRQVAHYGQVIRFDAFLRYNHNPITNLLVYGRLTPPEYDLSKVTVPSYLHYGLADDQAYYKDVLKLAATLPNVIRVNEMKRETFNHFDFIWATDAIEQVYDDVVASIRDAVNRFL